MKTIYTFTFFCASFTVINRFVRDVLSLNGELVAWVDRVRWNGVN